MTSIGQIVITRPHDQAIKFIKQYMDIESNNGQLKPENFILNPVFELENLDFELPLSHKVGGFLVTSGNAIATANFTHEHLSKPLYVVGEETATKAKQKGFTDIAFIAVDARSLVLHMTQNQAALPHQLTYLRGQDVSVDISSAFDSGYVDEVITYKAKAVTELTEVCKKALATGQEVSAVTFFSRRSATIFLDLIHQNNMMDKLSSIKALCISPSVLECVQPIFKENTYSAQTPDTIGMLNLVQKFYG